MQYPPESPCVLYGWVPRAWKNKNLKIFGYAHQILDSNNIEPPISENHNRMQIITSFSYCMHMIIFFCFKYNALNTYLTKYLNSG